MSELTLVDCDWLETQAGSMLHHARFPLIPDDEDIVELLWDEMGSDVRLDCGRTAKRVWIPGPFTRMSARRCSQCCRKNGLPPGVGSPKNDKECRRILGMDPAESSAQEGTT